MINTDEFFMKMALQEAKIAYNEGEISVGAVITCHDQVIAKAHNQTEKLNDVTAHAEMIAFTAAAEALGGKYLTDCTLYVTLEPCVMCAGASFWTQISRVVYGASDEKRGYSQKGNLLHPKTKIEGGLMAEISEEMLKAFFAARRK
ncbi:MAG: tRNA-specific adenosine deaminase [Salinivirgaceae bacterium]|nr:MAG: tRNA-specific adenosine deaminase [Salinivirgaceae bacterium]